MIDKSRCFFALNPLMYLLFLTEFLEGGTYRLKTFILLQNSYNNELIIINIVLLASS